MVSIWEDQEGQAWSDQRKHRVSQLRLMQLIEANFNIQRYMQNDWSDMVKLSPTEPKQIHPGPARSKRVQ